MRRLIAIVAVVLIPAFMTGCSSGTGTTTPLSLVGTWNLTTVNNSPLPLILLRPNRGRAAE